MFIRKASIEDSQQIAELLLMAMEDIIYKFIGKKDRQEATRFLFHFVRSKDNQYSYQNCLVAENNGEIIAAVNSYDGGKLRELREPIIAYLKANHGMEQIPNDETQAGEYYIDTLAVDPKFRGAGIGTKILQCLIGEYVVNQKHTLGLLVEKDNVPAKKLYLKLGFKEVGTKILVGLYLDHLQIKTASEP